MRDKHTIILKVDTPRPIFYPRSLKSIPQNLISVIIFKFDLKTIIEFIFEDKEVDERFLHRFEIISILRVLLFQLISHKLIGQFGPRDRILRLSRLHQFGL